MNAMPPDDVQSLRARLYDAGYRPVPVYSHDHPHKSAGKAPLGEGWPAAARQSPPFCVNRPSVPHAANTGILCDGLRAVDIDIDDRENAGRVKALAIELLGDAPLRYRANSPRCTIVYRAAYGEPDKRTLIGAGHSKEDGRSNAIEVLGKGQQFVGFGTHPSGAALQWQGDLFDTPRDTLPAVTEEGISDFLSAAAAIIGADAPEAEPGNRADREPSQFGQSADPLDIAAALAVIPNPGRNWDEWCRVGLATFAASGGSPEGFAAWGAWSAKCEGVHDIGACRDAWGGYRKTPPDRIGAGSLFHMAKEARPGWRKPSDQGGTKPERGDNPPDTEPTEDAVALAFAAKYEGRLVFDHTSGLWSVWRGGRWQRDTLCRATDTARSFCRKVRHSLDKPPQSMAKMAFWSAVERGSRSDRRMAVSQEIWDREPWLLGVPGGAVNLKTGQVETSRPDMYISRQTRVAPAAAGDIAPLWAKFLHDATNGDMELQGFLQRLAGYALTGMIDEEAVAFLYGSGGNGKGVYLGALTAILNEYAVSVPIEVFTANSRLNLEYYRAQMAGARLVTASETEAQATWAEAQIKEMTGNETPLSGRQPYGQPFTFMPQFKIVLVGNHAPKLKGRSAAMERRLRVVPFDNQPQNPDPELKDKLKAEYPAILRWMIDGCLAWQRNRLGCPSAVRAATSTYFEQQDAFSRWLDERCDLHPHFSTKPSALLADFTAWARGNGEEPPEARGFAEIIDRTPGLGRVKSNGVRFVKGIALKPEASWEAEGQ